MDRVNWSQLGNHQTPDNPWSVIQTCLACCSIWMARNPHLLSPIADKSLQKPLGERPNIPYSAVDCWEWPADNFQNGECAEQRGFGKWSSSQNQILSTSYWAEQLHATTMSKCTQTRSTQRLVEQYRRVGWNAQSFRMLDQQLLLLCQELNFL